MPLLRLLHNIQLLEINVLFLFPYPRHPYDFKPRCISFLGPCLELKEDLFHIAWCQGWGFRSWLVFLFVLILSWLQNTWIVRRTLSGLVAHHRQSTQEKLIIILSSGFPLGLRVPFRSFCYGFLFVLIICIWGAVISFIWELHNKMVKSNCMQMLGAVG